MTDHKFILLKETLMFPMAELTEILTWLKGGANPGLKKLLLDETALQTWAIGQMPDPAPSLMKAMSPLSKADLVTHLETLSGTHHNMAFGNVPPWLLPTLLQILQIILTNVIPAA